MKIILTDRETVKIDMQKQIVEVIDSFSEIIDEYVMSPERINLFETGDKRIMRLRKEQEEEFHLTIAKLICRCCGGGKHWFGFFLVVGFHCGATRSLIGWERSSVFWGSRGRVLLDGQARGSIPGVRSAGVFCG